MATQSISTLIPARCGTPPAQVRVTFSPAMYSRKVSLKSGKSVTSRRMTRVRLGEQIRFEIYNEGSWDHEFMLATKEDNRKHAEVMKKFPNMEHDDPNAKRLSPLSSAELLWKFTKRGEFEYGCLIPGHLEAGMHGKIIVK